MRTKLGIALVIIVLALVACATARDEGRTTKDEGRTTKDEGRAALVVATPTVAPTATPLPTATPTLAPTATPTLTPTPTLTEAQRRVAQLPPLANFKWQVKGDEIFLVDPQNPQNVLAQIDWQSGAIRWDSQKNFASLNLLIRADASLTDRATLTSFLSELEKQGIHFLSFADSRAGYPPYAVTLSADGKGIVLVQGFRGTESYRFDEKTQTLKAVAPDGKSYSYLNLKTGKFEYDEKAIEEYVSQISIEFPDPQKTAKVKEAVKWAFTHVPDVTPDELNKFMGVRGGKDFRTYFNETWAGKYGLDFDTLFAQYLNQMQPGSYPIRWLKTIRTIDTSRNLVCDMTCYRLMARNSFQIEILDRDFSGSLVSLAALVQKELLGGLVLNDLRYHKNVTGRDEAGSHAATIAETLSYALEAYVAKINGYSNDNVSALINWAWRGGFVVK
jgi:hypothetical protein